MSNTGLISRDAGYSVGSKGETAEEQHTASSPVLPSGWFSEEISYCSNVHAGESVAQIQHNLSHYIQPVCQGRNLPVMSTGLWISALAAEELQEPNVLAGFKESLRQNSLQLTSINGFPYGDFHQQQVKDQVYLPNWAEKTRLTYSKNLARVLAACLPEGQKYGSISTLPLGYKKHWSIKQHQAAIEHLAQLTDYLHQLKQETGKHILFCLEMEPDCVLESTDELVAFFVGEVQPKVPFAEHLAICYDVCHQAVMFEDAKQALQRISDAGITIGKIQLSNALQACFQKDVAPSAQASNKELLSLLQQFGEEKYLHQVKCQAADGHVISYPDLHLALKASATPETDNWRIHFHVPIHHEHLVHPSLKTTRDDLLQVFDFLQNYLLDPSVIKPCLEVETYSWNVLPEEIRPQNESELIAGIAQELAWVAGELQQRDLLKNAAESLSPRDQFRVAN